MNPNLSFQQPQQFQQQPEPRPSTAIPGMSPEQRMLDLEMKINKIYESVEKTRKYFLWTMIITVVLFVVPLIGLVFAIPSFINQYSQINNISSGI